MMLTGKVAVVMRGGCSFGDKALNVQARLASVLRARGFRWLAEESSDAEEGGIAATMDSAWKRRDLRLASTW